MAEPALHILIIDADRIRASVIEEGLRDGGHTRVTVLTDMSHLVRRVVEIAPDVIVIDLENPSRDALEHMFQVSRAVQRPVAMFVDRTDQDSIEAAIEAGVSAYVVDGLKKDRIKSILDTAVSRFRAFDRLRRDLDDARSELAERKTIDRAKGILMRTRGDERGGRLRAPAHDGDAPEPPDRGDCRQPDYGRRPARGGQAVSPSTTRSANEAIDIRVGFMPLVDCAPVIVAARLGHAEDEGLRLSLEQESSWAALRDRISVGLLDAAHMLAPMPIAANLGLTPLAAPLVAPLALGTGGNTVTVSTALAEDLLAAGGPRDLDPTVAMRAMHRVVTDRTRNDRPRLTLGIVHPHSAHHYQLAYWLAAAGLEPSRDVEFVAVPPPLMPAALAEGQIDGFCVGEPWGSVTVARGTGRILTTGTHIWRASPEKVLGLRRAFADADPVRVSRLVRAVHRAAEWCDNPANREELAALLSRPEHLGQPAAIIRRGLERRLAGLSGDEVEAPGFMTFAAGAATFPWISHAAWLYAQMVRWGQATHSPAALAAACASFRPDLTRTALVPLGVPLPQADAKVEGATTEPSSIAATSGTIAMASDGFFDGGQFDIARIDETLASYAAPLRA